MSIDGFIDDASAAPLVLSSDADIDLVDELRSTCDAILVGGRTVRRDNPRLTLKSEARREARQSRGLTPDLIKVTITRSGDLDPDTPFFQVGEAEKIVFCPRATQPLLAERLRSAARIIAADGADVAPQFILDELAAIGVKRLLIEGGSQIGRLFLEAGVVDELRVAVAPFFVGDPRAPRFVEKGAYPHDAAHRMALTQVEAVGDMAVLTYRLQRGVRS